jgi:quercetin dioxygenase-like cupin family protein
VLGKLKHLLIAAMMLATVLIGGATATRAQDTAEATPLPYAVIREELASGESPDAPGYTLTLWQYTIVPGTLLPVHNHPGTEIARVVSGELTYTVVSDGVVEITRAQTDLATPAATESLEPGQTTTFLPGDSFVEPGGMVHYAENRGSEPVILLVASLFKTGEPLTTVVDEGTPVP